jgi:hypothetical protein
MIWASNIESDLKSWAIDGSGDEVLWTEIDLRENNSDLDVFHSIQSLRGG